MATTEMMPKHGRRQGRSAVGVRGLGAAALTGAVLTGATLVLAGPAATAGATSSHVQTIHISTAKVPSVGTVLTTGTGLTLYRFTQDPAGSATCTGACAKVWPPLLASKGAHIAGPKGMKGLSLIKVTGGHFQVAFHHVALYRFTGDKKKGQAKGQGVESAWYAVLKSGLSSASASIAPSSTSTTTMPAGTTTTQAPHTATTSPPAIQTPVTQAPTPATTPPTQPPPTTTPPTQPPPTTTTTTQSPGGGAGF
jgi:predicted lipoprotein with Yx(FWY)xxD motif